MSWMNTITRKATRANPIRVPRPYETTPSMPDMLPSSPVDFRSKRGAKPASNDRGKRARPGNSGQDTEDHRCGIVGRAISNLDVGGRAHTDNGAGQLERHSGKRMVGVEHDLVLGHVGDREDQVCVVTARCALEAHSDLENLGKAAARLDSEEVFLIVAESILG